MRAQCLQPTATKIVIQSDIMRQVFNECVMGGALAHRASFVDHSPLVPVFATTSPNNLEYPPLRAQEPLAQELPPGSEVKFSHHFFLPRYWVFQLAQELPPGSEVKFSHHFFLPRCWVFHGSGGCRTAIHTKKGPNQLNIRSSMRVGRHTTTQSAEIHSFGVHFVNVVNCGKGEAAHTLAQRAGKSPRREVKRRRKRCISPLFWGCLRSIPRCMVSNI